MNKHKLAILGMSVMVLAASCRKMDVQHQPKEAPATATVASAATEATVNKAAWKSVAAWNSSKEDKYTSYSTRIQDNSLTASAIANGLVLVFKKDGEQVMSLPAQEAGTNRYWFYSVAEGELTINVDAYGSAQTLEQKPEIKYFIISEQQIKDLEAAGKSKISLMNLNYDAAQALLQK